MQTKKIKNKGEQIFKGLILLIVLLLVAFIFFKGYNFIIQGKIKQIKESLIQQEQELSAYESATSYDKFLLISDLEQKTIEMPWFEHIPKILQIFQDLQNLGSDSNELISLSDFEVSLNEITLKGSVSSLKVLYYSSPSGSFKALLDRFEELDFIKDITIRSYNRASDRYFEFILNAKVISNEGK